MEIMIPNRENQRYEAAKMRVKKIRGFYVHLAVYAFVNISIIFFNGHQSIFGNGHIEFSSFYTAFFWGIGLFCHWIGVFGQNWILGKKWEERKIQELVEKEKRERTRWE